VLEGDIMKSCFDFATSYSGYAGKSYISFSVPDDEEIVQYQTEMLAKNHIDFLLPLSVQRFNDNWKLSYEITSKIPLEKVLERKSFKYKEFESIIEQMGKLSMKLRDYLLDVSSVIFDKSFIYCDPGDLSLYFIYFPVKAGNLNTASMKDFLQKLIFEDIRLLDDSSGNLLKRLLDVLKSETFNPEQLLKCFGFEIPENPDCINRTGNEKYAADVIPDQSYNAVGTKKDQEKREETVPKAKAYYQKNSPVKQEKDKSFSTARYPVKSCIIAVVANMFLVASLIIVLISKASSRNFTGTLLGLMLIGFAGNYFIITRLFSGNNQTQNEEQRKNNVVPHNRRFSNENADEDIILPKRVPVNAKVWLNPELKADHVTGTEQLQSGILMSKHKTMECDESGLTENKLSISPVMENSTKSNHTMTIQDKTVVLGYSAGDVPYLQSHSCPTERIRITKESMLLGRLSDSVDYTINNKAVGKIHAEIVKKGDSYYIMDLNSVNGTYVNNERITCSTEIKLKNGDIITLANETYTFVIN